MRIGYNLFPQDTQFDREKAKAHIAAIKPHAVLSVDDIDFLDKLNVPVKIYRAHGSQGDDANIKRYSPEAFLKAAKAWLNGRPNTWMQVCNEPGFDADVVRWHTEMAKLNLKPEFRLPLVMLNLAIGFPHNFGDWSQLDEMLRITGDNPDLFIIGLHEYGLGVLWSGTTGGHPQEYYHEGKLLHRDYIKAPPTAEEFQKETLFHTGRCKELVAHCRRNGLPQQRIIVNEHGMDGLSDLSEWAGRLHRTPPYGSINGWKTCVNQWAQWFPGRNPEDVYADQLTYVDTNLYQHIPGVEAQLIFGWGHTSERWEPYDVKDAITFQRRMVEYANFSPSPSQPPPIVPTNPTSPISESDRKFLDFAKRYAAGEFGDTQLTDHYLLLLLARLNS